MKRRIRELRPNTRVRLIVDGFVVYCKVKDIASSEGIQAIQIINQELKNEVQLHRLDGPALIWANGGQVWWMDGHNITPQVKSWMKLRDVTWPWDESTQVEFLLSWSGK